MSDYAGKTLKRQAGQSGPGPQAGSRRPAPLADNRPQAILQRRQQEAAPVVQRVVDPYQADRALRANYKVMRGLTLKQMDVVHDLHEESKHYSIDEARNRALGISTTTANKYEWDVDNNLGSYQSPNADIQGILSSYGHPTTDVVKTYDDLARRISFDAGKSGKGILQPGTASDLHLMFDAMAPLHFATNNTLGKLWQNNLDGYGGAKTGIPLYSTMRSEMTKDFKHEYLGNKALNELLWAVSGKAPEVHHLEYKALYPKLASNIKNLMLTERSDSEKRSGMGQHELMHWVGSGANPNKFKVLMPQYKDEYEKWVKHTTGSGF